MPRCLMCQRFIRWAAGVLFVLTIAARAEAGEAARAPGSMIHRSIPPPGATTHTVVLGERFKAGWFKRWILGSDYRDLWTTPIEFPVLNLDSVGGGLTPVGTGGAGQSISLHLKGADGKPYTVRSIDKDPTKRIWDELKNTVVDDILQDLISAQFPTAGLVVDPLMDATGILHSPHTLVVIPDDPRLGEYRDEFAGLIGTLQEHPSEGPDDTPGFAGSSKITGTEKLWERLEEGDKCQYIDTRAYLKARLLDMLINDKDRHPGQWRWARYPDGDCYIWEPIPEDRDQAFIDLDGFGMAVVRRAVPRQIKFEDKYPNVAGLTLTGWDDDRQFLAELSWPVWDSVVTAFQSELTDQVIDDAVRRLPAPYYELVGPELTHALKSRRDRLPKFARAYYRLITRDAEITASDADEYVELEHTADGSLDVRIGVLDDDGRTTRPLRFHRTFIPDETHEVRLYLHGGDDRVEVSGGKAEINLRVDGGGGDDSYVNQSRAGAKATRFYDYRGTNTYDRGRGAYVNERPYTRPIAPNTTIARYALDWGKQGFYFPIVNYSPDLGVYVGLIGGWQYFGYRKYPYASKHSISMGLASHGVEPLVSYSGKFRHLWPSIDGKLKFEYSGINVIRFHGFGNATEVPEETSFYEVDQEEFLFAPSVVFHAGTNRGTSGGVGKEALRPTLTIALGPIAKYANTSLDGNEDKFIATYDPPLYGTESFAQGGGQGSVAFDTRDNPGNAKRGVLIQASGAAYPGLWDVESMFGEVHGAASAYWTAPMPLDPTIALRGGGQKVWGTYPFHEAAFLGGQSDLRGYREDRFAGDASLYGNAELRFDLFKIKFLLPGKFGVFGAVDAGRMYFAGDPGDADEWKTAQGGGVSLSFLQRMQTLSVAIMKGDDLTGVYARAGFMY